MNEIVAEAHILDHFADILAYPRGDLLERARRCAARVAEANGEAGRLLRAFATFVAETPPGRLEEIYTATFDLEPSCFPYISYHLFGESYKRSAFVVGLRSCYRAHGFDVADELPDHLTVLLRFLATRHDAEAAGELIEDALLPALEQMLGSEADHANPYRGVLRALQRVLKGQAAPAITSARQGGENHA